MREDIKKTMEALQLAIQMEIEGRKFYLKANQESRNSLAKELFQTLADEEIIHQEKAKKIYDSLKNSQEWPDEEINFDRGKKLSTIFARAMKDIDKEAKVGATELNAVKIAMNMESKSYDFYQSRANLTAYPTEKRFFQALTAEERGHYLVLLDLQEYLTDPTDWFAKTEHTSLDGG